MSKERYARILYKVGQTRLLEILCVRAHFFKTKEDRMAPILDVLAGGGGQEPNTTKGP